jgi:hypothetical protein
MAVPIRELYSHYEYSDLASHPAAIIIPYQGILTYNYNYYDNYNNITILYQYIHLPIYLRLPYTMHYA